jgi:hypothetical protein
MSCSSGDSSNTSTSQDVLIKKIISSEGWSQIFSYDGNKLVKIIFDDGTSRVVTYSGNYIIKTEIRDASNIFRGEYETFSYLNNRISQLKSFYNNIIVLQQDFNYNSDATIITVSEKSYNSSGNLIGTSYKKQYIDSNGSLIKTENLNSSNVVTQTDNFTYDVKNGIYKNILGFSVVPSLMMGKFNLVSHISLYNNVVYSYQYNNQNYPISSTETTRLSNGSRVVTYQYLY